MNTDPSQQPAGFTQKLGARGGFCRAGQWGHSVVPGPPAAPLLGHFLAGPEAASYQPIIAAGFPASLPKAVLQGF